MVEARGVLGCTLEKEKGLSVEIQTLKVTVARSKGETMRTIVKASTALENTEIIIIHRVLAEI